MNIDNPTTEARSRLTVVEQVYHQSQGSNPVTTDCNFGLWLDSDEQPFIRHAKIGPEWKPIECGWVTEASLVVIKNNAPKNSGLVVEVSCSTDAANPDFSWLIAPGHSFRGCPSRVDVLVMRCVRGEARVTLNIFPK